MPATLAITPQRMPAAKKEQKISIFRLAISSKISFLISKIKKKENGMKKLGSLFCVAILASFVMAVACGAAESTDGQQIIRKGEQAPIKGPAEIFTGDVQILPIYPANHEMRSSGGLVTFEPGARSNWHIHPVGQVLIITSGRGRTQEWGKPVQEVKEGDVIICPVGVKHWHGGAPDSRMSHISICEEKEPGKVVEWMEKVTDDQYMGK